jgi:predicted RNA-binding protein with PIN domain
MALHLIIDGYNLIRQSPGLRPLEAQDLEAGREALLQRLAAYRRRRPQHKITVVFDGWQAGDLKESRDQQQGLALIFSRRGERADEVIKRLLAQERQRAVVVSSDRELREFADRVRATWITAAEFEMSYLYEAGSSQGDGDDQPPGRPRQKKGPSRRPAKSQRQRQRRLKKL